jgi:hypothetical protein
MAELVDREPAHEANEPAPPTTRHQRWETVVEVVEVVVLAIVAVATAWSGYQAAKWDGRQSLLYGRAFTLRFQADTASTFGSQRLAADAALFTAWLQARAANDALLQAQYVNRFSSDFKTGFTAWLATDPFTNPNAPSGPAAMPQYQNPYITQATRLNNQASTTFDHGTGARDSSDKYVRYTVLLASVLFLIALAQRLRVRSARIGLNAVAFGLLIFVGAEVLALPRL